MALSISLEVLSNALGVLSLSNYWSPPPPPSPSTLILKSFKIKFMLFRKPLSFTRHSTLFLGVSTIVCYKLLAGACVPRADVSFTGVLDSVATFECSLLLVFINLLVASIL